MNKKTLVNAITVGAIAAVLIFFISTLILNPIYTLIYQIGIYGSVFSLLRFVVNTIRGFGCGFVAIYIFCKFIAKTKMDIKCAIITCVIAIIAERIVGFIPYVSSFVNFFLNLIVYSGAFLFYLAKNKEEKKAAPVVVPVAPVQEVTATVVTENTDNLFDALQMALRPSLGYNSQLTMSEAPQMKYSNENQNEYIIDGTVIVDGFLTKKYTAVAFLIGENWVVSQIKVY